MDNIKELNSRNKDTVCAVVVTFNRKDLLLECLSALQAQTLPVDAIYIIDNASTDGTPELLLSSGYVDSFPPFDLKDPIETKVAIGKIDVYYVRMHQNTGGAGGFHEGVKRAYEKGFNWLWLMDDDAIAHVDANEYLAPYRLDGVSGIASTVLNTSGEVDIKHRGQVDFINLFPMIQQPIPSIYYKKKLLSISAASFVGVMISSKIVAEIGYPNSDFFIHHDDIDYTIKLSSSGPLLLVPESKFTHKEASVIHRGRVSYDKFWIKYFGIRNHVFLAKKLSNNRALFYLFVYYKLIRMISGVVLLDDHKIKRSWFLLNAVYDGLTGSFDNNKPKKILY